MQAAVHHCVLSLHCAAGSTDSVCFLKVARFSVTTCLNGQFVVTQPFWNNVPDCSCCPVNLPLYIGCSVLKQSWSLGFVLSARTFFGFDLLVRGWKWGWASSPAGLGEFSVFLSLYHRDLVFFTLFIWWWMSYKTTREPWLNFSAFLLNRLW